MFKLFKKPKRRLINVNKEMAISFPDWTLVFLDGPKKLQVAACVQSKGLNYLTLHEQLAETDWYNA